MKDTKQIFDNLRKQFPSATDEEIETAIYFNASLAADLSNYSNLRGRRGRLKGFIAKAGKGFGKLMQNKAVKGLVSAAGAALGVPPQAVNAGMGIVGSVVESGSTNYLSKKEKEKAEQAAQQAAAEAAAEAAKQQAAKAVAAKAEAVRLQSIATEAEAETKKGLPLGAWLGIGGGAVVLIVVVLFVFLRS